jgi:hypothetical protein
MKTVYGILNWNRKCDHLLDFFKDDEIILCTNNPIKEDCKYSTIVADQNVAKCKNDIIKKAKDLNADFLFIVEDDVIINDKIVFEKYIKLMQEYELGVVYYGYDGTNTILNGIPNPSLIIKLNDDGKELFINRYICSSIVGIDLNNNKELFNENLLTLEHEEYFSKCAKNKIIEFEGFFFDIEQSWIYFDRIDCAKERIQTVELAKQDNAYLKEDGFKITYETNADKLLNYLAEKYNN